MTDYFDIENAVMVMPGGGNSNRWQTGVECILSRIDHRNEVQVAWLSHECRAEHISPERIFDGSRHYEFLAVQGWDGSICIRSGPYNYGLNPIKNYWRNYPAAVYDTGTLEIQVFCAVRKIRVLDFSEALANLRGRDDGKRDKIFMLVEYEKGPYRYSLTTQCKYVNFPGPSSEQYIQPISGYVLFEDDGKFHVSYVAAHIRDNGVKSVEFCLRERTSYLNTKSWAGPLYLFRLLDQLLFKFIFVTDEFTRIEKASPAKCTLFVYEN